MAKENDTKVDDIEIPEEENLEGLDEATDWKAKADELQKKHREAGIRNRERTKSLRDQVAALNAKLVETVPPPEKKDNKPNEPDYGQLSYLKVSGVEHEEDVAYVLGISKETKETLDKVLAKPYVQAEIKLRAENRKTAEAIPESTKKSSNAKRDEAEFYLSKPFSEVPADMKANVVNARIASEKKGQKKFSDVGIVQ